MDLALNYSDTASTPPPPGIVPDFVDPVTNTAAVIIVISILLPLMLVFVALRVYSNLCISRKFAQSDCKYPPFSMLASLLMASRCMRARYGTRIHSE